MNRWEIDSALASVGDRLQDKTTIVLAGSAMLVLRDMIQREAADCDVCLVAPPASSRGSPSGPTPVLGMTMAGQRTPAAQKPPPRAGLTSKLSIQNSILDIRR